MSSAEKPQSKTGEKSPDRLPLDVELLGLLVVLPLGWVAQLMATDLTPWEAAAGMLLLGCIAVVGILMARATSRLRLPAVAWVSLVGIIVSLPAVPGSGTVNSIVGGIDFLALSVPCLAFAGLAIGTRELDVVKHSGWKLLIIGLLVLVGSFFGSAVIAHFVLGWLN